MPANSPPTMAQIKLHPLSEKNLLRSHPWITADEFSQKFPPPSPFLQWRHFQLLHDPAHKKIKARLWNSKKSPAPLTHSSFVQQSSARLKTAFQKREQNFTFQNRNHGYLCFGEADHMPGLLIRRLGQHIIFEIYCYFWLAHQQQLKTIITQLAPSSWGKLCFWSHPRSEDYSGQTRLQLQSLNQLTSPHQDQVHEQGLNLQVTIGKHYDYGIYSDMAAIREQIPWPTSANSNVLNLFCYTGIFSLLALQQGHRVTSVDSSQTVIQQLQENLALNSLPQSKQHQILCASTSTSLKKLHQQQQQFDLIICDPPSSYTEKGKRFQTTRTYPTLLKQMAQCLSPQGRILLFCNTHSLSRAKWKKLLQPTLSCLRLKIRAEYHLTQDCPLLPHFPQGDYLKGVELVRND